MRTANPANLYQVFADARENLGEEQNVMTVQGTVNKVGFLFILALATAAFSWWTFFNRGIEATMPLVIVGFIGGLIFALISIFAKKATPFTAPIYALFEGLALGGLSAILELQYPGIAIQSVALTFGTLFVLIVAYTTGLIRATPAFKRGIIVATGAIAIFYLASWIFSMFGSTGMREFMWSPSLLSIGLSLVIVVVAALNLILDFAVIEEGAEAKAPKYLEWYAAFGLMLTLVWLYMEILRLLSKLRR